MRPGDPRDMLEVTAERLGHGFSPRPSWGGDCPDCHAIAGTNCAVVRRRSHTYGWWQRTAVRLLAAFLLGLAVGIVIAGRAGAAPRPASESVVSSRGMPIVSGADRGAVFRGSLYPVTEQSTSHPGGARLLAPSTGGAPPSPALTRSGVASTVGPRFPATYLALPVGPGFTVRICGAAACVTRTSTDAGPVPSLHRVADLSVADFEAVSGQPWRRGLASVTVTVLRVPQ